MSHTATIATVAPAAGTLLALAQELASEHGWTLAGAEEHPDNPNGARCYRRDNESIVMRTWPHTGGVPTVTADLAAGRVATRQFGRSWTGHNVPESVIVEAFTGPRAESFPASPYVLAVDAGEFADHSRYETASNYDTVRVESGRYPVELLDDSGRVVASVDKARRFVARVPSTIVRQYAVNRLFSATSVRDETVSIPSAQYVTGHTARLAAGEVPTFFDGLAAVVFAV